LTGEGQNSTLDKKNLKLLQDIENLDQPIKEHLHFVIDNIIQNTKAKRTIHSGRLWAFPV
jgi:hypothetical protein